MRPPTFFRRSIGDPVQLSPTPIGDPVQLFRDPPQLHPGAYLINQTLGGPLVPGTCEWKHNEYDVCSCREGHRFNRG